ncbi:unnamed protein product, partial [Owenia fusiformis]
GQGHFVMLKRFLNVIAVIIRFVLFRLLLLAQICRRTPEQMFLQPAVQSSWTFVTRNRRVVIGILVVLALLLYLWPSLPGFSRKSTYDKSNQLVTCVEEKLEAFQDQVGQFDASIQHIPASEQEAAYIPFVGNGYIGVTYKGEHGLTLKYGRALSVFLPYYPMVLSQMEGHDSRAATISEYKNGVIYTIDCFQKTTLCMTSGSQIYAHRSRPSILVQDIRIYNPSDNAMTLDLLQVGTSDWKDSSTQTFKTSSKLEQDVDCLLTTGTYPVPKSDSLVFVVAIATVKVPDTVEVKSGGTVKYHVVTSVQYSTPISHGEVEEKKKELEESAKNDLSSTLKIDVVMLRNEHTKVWNQLWESGFSISYSLAPGAINGNRINATMYYVMSNLRSLIHEVNVSPVKKLELQKLLFFPDRCYSGHHTLQAPGLWIDTPTQEDTLEVVNRWIITLEKQGCISMLQAGADGALQAMILSFGAFQFTHHHLEFKTDPKDLHRDYLFRRINYGNNTHVNVTVEVGEDNRAMLYAALDKNDKEYYACDAGCLDPPVKLSKQQTYFPVKLTQPMTAVLYITADHEHMQELKVAINVKEVNYAPAHEHHVIAVHKHGHSYGGLPAIFWVSIIVLIIIFHLFLFKLIFNEYCQGQARFTSGRYNL